MVNVLVKRIHKFALLPEFNHSTDACADISACENVLLEPNEIKAVSTGLKFSTPHNYEIQVRPRSGLALKHGITLLNTPGTIDSEYRGEVKIILINHSNVPFRIQVGDRIAQIAVRPVPSVTFVESDELDKTKRDTKGFGSSGVKPLK